LKSVTAIIPTYNEPDDAIAATVKSAWRAGAGAVIVIDDGSARVPAQPIGAYMWRQDHAGIAAALNHGIRKAETSHVAILAVGDRWDAAKVPAQLALDAPASFHAYRDGYTRRFPLEGWQRNLRTDNQFCGSTVMLERDVALAFPYDESLRWCCDWDFAARIQFEGPGWTFCDQVLGEAFEHPGGHTQRAMADDELRRLRYACRAKVSKRWRKAPCR
jgi:glycosyltransferase involved in cell wall biosynthesis